jgi:hypothetical protein
MKKVIIAGGRDLFVTSQEIKSFLVQHGYSIEFHVVSGGATGIDACGERYSQLNKLPLTIMQADWEKHGKSAGPIRNRQMAEFADELLLIWDGKSKGSANMKKTMEKLGKPVIEWVVKK